MSSDLTQKSISFNSARFLISASRLEECPLDSGAEVAFAGRSNAGKSSAINSITANGKLARTSKTPGRTRLINFFTLNRENCRLVDLPGYGYAKVSKSKRNEWQEHLDHYLSERQALVGLVLMMDIRHPLKDFDLLMLPHARHGFGKDGYYVMRRRWDYFVQHLLGATPPAGYEIKPPQP